MLFPGNSVGKESACNAGDLGSIPGFGRSPGEGKMYPLQSSGLENSMDCIDRGVTKSQTRLSNFPFTLMLFTHKIWGLPRWLSGKESTCQAGDRGSIPGSERSPGGGQGHPLQYSYLDSPMDRGAWWATSSPGGHKRVRHDLATKQQLIKDECILPLVLAWRNWSYWEFIASVFLCPGCYSLQRWEGLF